MSIKGIANIKKKVAEKAFTSDGEGVFVQLKDGESQKMRFLQELDESSPGYDERSGTITVIEEHSAPKNFKISAKCTAESEGRCWACEQTSDPNIGKKWNPKLRFYANVAVLTEKDGKTPLAAPKVKILKRGFSDKDVGNDLINIVEEFETLVDKDVKLSRKGAEMNNTSYSLLPLAPKASSKEVQALELIDPNKFIKIVAYENQAAFYSGEEEEGGNAAEWLNK